MGPLILTERREGMKIELTEKALEITIEDIREIHDVSHWASLDEGELTTKWLELEEEAERLTQDSRNETPCIIRPQIIVKIPRNGDTPTVKEELRHEYV